MKRVLLVDDNEDNREVFCAILEHAGYGVLKAADGAEGVQIARAYLPHLILMDLSMPVMDGWEAASELREYESTREIPVFAVSAHVLMRGDPARIRAAGFLKFLLKPLEPGKLLTEVKAQIGRP